MVALSTCSRDLYMVCVAENVYYLTLHRNSLLTTGTQQVLFTKTNSLLHAKAWVILTDKMFSERSQTQLHPIWFYLDNVQKQAKLISGDGGQASDYLCVDARKEARGSLCSLMGLGWRFHWCVIMQKPIKQLSVILCMLLHITSLQY